MFQMKFLIKNWPSAGPSNNCILACPVNSPCFYQSTLQFYDDIYMGQGGMSLVCVGWRENPVNSPLKMC